MGYVRSKVYPNAQTFDNFEFESIRNHAFKTVLAYLYDVVLMSVLKLALLGTDIYTCVKLLAFDSWSSNVIKPYLSFRVTKWLFSGCIFASLVLLMWNIFRSWQVSRTKNISLTYINDMARRYNSMADYSKFCLYNKLTPKGFFQKASFFVFFELKDCLGFLLTDTPRQVINGLTLWSVLITVGQDSDLSRLDSISGIGSRVKTIAKTNHQEAVILSLMLFSFALWVVFMAKFILALLVSVYVYYRLIKEQHYSGLKDMICSVINNELNQMAQGYKLTRTENLQSNDDLSEHDSKLSFYVPDLEKNMPYKFKDGDTGETTLTLSSFDEDPIIIYDEYYDNKNIDLDAYQDINAMSEPQQMHSFLVGSPENTHLNVGRTLYTCSTINGLGRSSSTEMNTSKELLISSTNSYSPLDETEGYSRSLNQGSITDLKRYQSPFLMEPPINEDFMESNMNMKKDSANQQLHRIPPPIITSTPTLRAVPEERIYTPERAYFRND